MVDLERTEKEYEKQGIPFPEDKAAELNRVKKWKHQATSEQGNFNQNPDNKSEQYPQRVVSQIIRKYILDEDKEYLTTIETRIGRDGIGNDVRLPVSEPQCYDTPIVRRHREYQDGRDVIRSEADGYERKHTVPFSEEAFKEEYSKAKKSTVSLLVREVGLGRKEVVVKDPEQFMKRKFYDLLDEKPLDNKDDQKKDKPKVTSAKVSTIEGEVGVIAE